MSLAISCFLFLVFIMFQLKVRSYGKVGERGGFGWGGVEGWREKAHNCN